MKTNLLKQADYQDRYRVEVNNQFGVLLNDETIQTDNVDMEENIDRKWKTIKETLVQCTEKVLPKKRRELKQSWMTNENLQLMETRKQNKKTKQVIDGTVIEQIKKFKYLGQVMNEENKCDDEIVKRIETAQNVFNKMQKTITSQNININIETRKRIVRCYIWSTLLYGCETWILTKQHVHK